MIEPGKIRMTTRFLVDVTIRDKFVYIIAERFSQSIVEVWIKCLIKDPIGLVFHTPVFDHMGKIRECLNIDIVLLIVVVSKVDESIVAKKRIKVANRNHWKFHLGYIDLFECGDHFPAEKESNGSIDEVSAHGERAHKRNEPNDAEKNAL